MRTASLADKSTEFRDVYDRRAIQQFECVDIDKARVSAIQAFAKDTKLRDAMRAIMRECRERAGLR